MGKKLRWSVREDMPGDELTLLQGMPSHQAGGEKVITGPAPSPQRETCIIVTFMLGLLVLSGALLRSFEQPKRQKPRLAIQHAFVFSRAEANASENGQLKRLRRQLEGLGMDSAKRITVAYVDAGGGLNRSDPLVAAALRISADGHHAHELLAYRKLVDALGKWSHTAPAEPIVLVASQRAVLTPGGAAVLDEALRYLESGRVGGWDALYAGHCGECGWWVPPRSELSSAAYPLGAGLADDVHNAEHFAQRRARDVGCGTLLSRARDKVRHTRGKLPATRLNEAPPVDADDVVRALRHRVITPLGGDSAVLATAVDPRCSYAIVLRYTERVARLLHTAVHGGGVYRAVVEPKFDLTLARMAADHALRSFVVWPPVVHLQRDTSDVPTDGYGGNSSRLIEAWLEQQEE